MTGRVLFLLNLVIITMKNNLDCLFVHSDSSTKAYQSLSGKFSGIEPPTWSLLLAESCRSKGFKVGILDCCAENLGFKEATKRIQEINPKSLYL